MALETLENMKGWVRNFISAHPLFLKIIFFLVLLVLCAVWLFWKSMSQSAHILLAVILFASTLVILACADSLAQKDENTKMLAILTVAFAIFFTLFSLDLVKSILGVWILVMVLCVIFLVVLAIFITGRPMGLFIDSRNKMSLATLQTILWTVIILSAFFTVAAAFVQAGKGADAFNIALDEKLWALLGISVTTLAGTPLIKDVKSKRTVNAIALEGYRLRSKTAIKMKVQQLGLSKSTADEEKAFDQLHDGPLAVGPCPKDQDHQEQVSFLDLFRGDEIVDCHRVDLGKVQMFFFTVIGALAYMLVLASWIATLDTNTIINLANAAAASTAVVNATAGAASGAAVVSFPTINEGFIAILGISHAGFLGNIAAPKTPEAT